MTLDASQRDALTKARATAYDSYEELTQLLRLDLVEGVARGVVERWKAQRSAGTTSHAIWDWVDACKALANTYPDELSEDRTAHVVEDVTQPATELSAPGENWMKWLPALLEGALDDAGVPGISVRTGDLPWYGEIYLATSWSSLPQQLLNQHLVDERAQDRPSLVEIVDRQIGDYAASVLPLHDDRGEPDEANYDIPGL